MTILTTYYKPTYFTPVAWGEEIFFDYPTSGKEAMEVYEITEDGTRTLVPLDSYYIEFAGDPGLRGNTVGGRVFFTKPYLDDTFVISVERNTTMVQTADFYKYGDFHLGTIEAVMDKITMILQEIAFRKCTRDDGPYVTTEITQLISFYDYGPFTAAALDHVINKATQITLQLKLSKTDCSETPEDT